MEYEFEEDAEPTWLVKQREDAKLTEAAFAKNEKIIYKKGDQVGNFLFVHYNKFKNRATFECQECSRKFTYNIYSIKNKKKIKILKINSYIIYRNDNM